MSADSAALTEPVNAFPGDNILLVKHYFDGEAVFNRLKPFYNGHQYRFEIPVGEFGSIRQFLHEHGYDVTIVDDPTNYYVVVKKYTAHPENIFKASVRQESKDGYNCFLMKDQAAVKDAVSEGATRLRDTPWSASDGTLGRYANP